MTGVVPAVWKTSNIVPIANQKHFIAPKDFTPIALICMEKIVLQKLTCLTEDSLDPYLFAYKRCCGTSDAINTLKNEYTLLPSGRRYSLQNSSLPTYLCPFNYLSSE